MKDSVKLQKLIRNLFLTSLGIVFCLPATVFAQGVLEEILVTATRRGETDIQVTPISVTALGADALDKMLMRDLGDMTAAEVDAGDWVVFPEGWESLPEYEVD